MMGTRNRGGRWGGFVSCPQMQPDADGNTPAIMVRDAEREHGAVLTDGGEVLLSQWRAWSSSDRHQWFQWISMVNDREYKG